MYKIKYLIGNWNIKKAINNNISVTGKLSFYRKNKNHFIFKEQILSAHKYTKYQGFQNFLLEDLGNNIIFKFNVGVEKNKVYQKFSKIKNNSMYFCKKDLYFMYFKVLSKNFFITKTLIRGPKKNVNIFAKYYRTI